VVDPLRVGTETRRGWRGAVVIDDWALVRLGIRAVLARLRVPVLADAALARDGLRVADRGRADLVVVGSAGDLGPGEAVRAAKRLGHPPYVVTLVGRPDRAELAGLLGSGVDALLLRSADPLELEAALDRLPSGERVVAPALLPFLVGVVDLTVPEPGSPGLLTVKEREVLARLAEGRSNRAIAAALHVTPATVKTHLAHIYEKLDARDRHDAVVRAVALGLLN
jgi:DNA-binding NarL/FixJ family response regulator